MKTNKEYTDAVEAGNFPEESEVPIDSIFKDDRGRIMNLLTNSVNGVAVITSKAGSVRSNHYHKTDYHYLYVLSGSCKYYERSLDGTVVKEPVTLYGGQMFFTPPMVVHKVEFLEDTILLSLSRNARDHESHESDVVREDY